MCQHAAKPFAHCTDEFKEPFQKIKAPHLIVTIKLIIKIIINLWDRDRGTSIVNNYLKNKISEIMPSIIPNNHT
jgi:hypothetical protein